VESLGVATIRKVIEAGVGGERAETKNNNNNKK